jgi:hypothetical protein
LDGLIERRKRLRNRLRRPPGEEAAIRTRQEIAALSKEISTVRQEVKRCNDIQTRSKSMAEKLKIIHRDERRKEELLHGHQRTGR